MSVLENVDRVQRDLRTEKKQSGKGENHAFWMRTRFKVLHLSSLYKKTVEE